jgi:hypothetical protein
VLLYLLEPDSELYNTGIVDVLHRFHRMYKFAELKKAGAADA